MKSKEQYLADELNIDKLTPLQYSGIIRAMEAYSSHKNLISARWVPVSEKLPSEDGRYVVFTSEGKEVMDFDSKNKIWSNDIGIDVSEPRYLTHWIKLDLPNKLEI